MNLKLELKPR